MNRYTEVLTPTTTDEMTFGRMSDLDEIEEDHMSKTIEQLLSPSSDPDHEDTHASPHLISDQP